MDDSRPGGGPARRSRPSGPVLAAVVWAGGSALAFSTLDPVLAAFVCILGLTLVGVAFFSSDWVRSTSFEEREAERVRRRKARWEAGAEARDRDRARWEAHRARTGAGGSSHSPSPTGDHATPPDGPG